VKLVGDGGVKLVGDNVTVEGDRVMVEGDGMMGL
jgi:hypothetical protein